MDPRSTLENWQFQAAMNILEREQKAFLPTAAELRRNRLFNGTVYLLVALYAVLLIAKDRDWFLTLFVRSDAYLYAVMALALIAVVGAALNLPLFLKLWRHERLRNRLGLRQQLAPLIAVRRGLGSRLLSALWSLLLTAFAVLCLLLLAVMIGKWSVAIARIGWINSILLAVSFAGVAFSLLFQPLVQRARKRLEIVQGLRRALADQERAAVAGAAAPGLTAQAYRNVTEVESSQILTERDRSLRSARSRKKSGQTGHAVRQTAEVLRSRARLEPETALKVGDQILALSDDPRPAAAVSDPTTGHYTLEIPGTPLRLRYEIDPSRRVLRVVALEGSGPDRPTGSGPE